MLAHVPGMTVRPDARPAGEPVAGDGDALIEAAVRFF
jgi:hypothetical protein